MGNECSACNCQKAEKTSEFQFQVSFDLFEFFLYFSLIIIARRRCKSNSKII